MLQYMILTLAYYSCYPEVCVISSASGGIRWISSDCGNKDWPQCHSCCGYNSHWRLHSKGYDFPVTIVSLLNLKPCCTTAVADYLPITMVMVFTPEDIVKSFNVTVISDEVFESVERFDVVLSLMDDMGNSRELDRLSIIISDSSSGMCALILIFSRYRRDYNKSFFKVWWLHLMLQRMQ